MIYDGRLSVFYYFSIIIRGDKMKKHTITGNVSIIRNFYLKELGRKRKIWIYLPPEYEKSSERYPVLYMHDGQNIFDEYTSFCGEWKVDEILEDLYEKNTGKKVIIVAVDNGKKERLNEYSPWKSEINSYRIKRQGGLGDKYTDSIVYSLKPFIDKNYRTLKEDNGIMGSSMGGLISLYASLKYPEIFKRVGVLSPAFWFAKKHFLNFIDKYDSEKDIKIFFYAGEKESEEDGLSEKYKNDTSEFADILRKKGFDNINILFDKNGIHNESAWSQHFKEIFLWLYE